MKIVADENIVAVGEYFADIGDLITLPGREISPALLRDADALLVRSVTRVDEALLGDTSVQYVGTATSGLDHVDLGYLRGRGIAFSDAAGANANAVAEYVLSALAALQAWRGLQWPDCSVGIVGAGNIGGLLARKLAALGLPVAVYDPFLRQEDLSAGRLCGFEEVLRQDIVTLHTPLTRDGPHPTRHLIDAAVLARMTGAQVLINAARGAVVDNAALRRRLEAGDAPLTVLDTWENEPLIDLALRPLVNIATPHIAGYSLDGKRGGTERIFQGFCRHFHLEQLVKRPEQDECFDLDLSCHDGKGPSLAALDHCLLSAYNILADHQDMEVLDGVLHPGRHFDRLRKQYPARYEFSHYRVRNVADPAVGRMLGLLGFQS